MLRMEIGNFFTIQQQTNTKSICNNQLNDDFTRIYSCFLLLFFFVYMSCMIFMRRTSSILTLSVATPPNNKTKKNISI